MWGPLILAAQLQSGQDESVQHPTHTVNPIDIAFAASLPNVAGAVRHISHLAGIEMGDNAIRAFKSFDWAEATLEDRMKRIHRWLATEDR